MQGLIGLLMVLFVIAMIIEFFWFIVAVLVVIGFSVGSVALAVMLVGHASGRAEDRAGLAAESGRNRVGRAAALVARADQQHRWYLEGDPRGIYGQYPPVALDR